MENSAEYNRLVRQKASAQAQYKSSKANIEECEYTLRRLRAAKQSIEEIKSAYKDVKQSDERVRGMDHKWLGQTFHQFDAKLLSVVQTNDKYYSDSIDYVLDTLNNEITNLENEKMRENGILGELASWINNLTNKIENFFN